MRIALFSDIHREYGDWAPKQVDADVICLLGDIATEPAQYRTIVERVRTENPRARIIALAGNHEAYGGDWTTFQHEYAEAVAGVTGVDYLDGRTVVIDGIAFIGTTLWSDLSNPLEAEAARRISDYRAINVGRGSPTERKLRTGDTHGAHLAARAFVEAELRRTTGTTRVVLTHHAPSRRSRERRFDDRSPELTGAFCSDLDKMIRSHRPAAWLHGHTHTACHYRIGTTVVRCNPRGYVGHETNTGFDPKGAVFTVETSP